MLAKVYKQFLVTILVALVFGVGCRSRCAEYQVADSMAHCLIAEKAPKAPGGIPVDFSLIPKPESRLAVQGSLVCPSLPKNLVELYAYQLPLQNFGPGDAQQDDSTDQAAALELIGIPIPMEAWEAIPASCLKRMFDFESIRNEAALTEKNSGDQSLLRRPQTKVPELTLNDIIELALLNSRDYQTQKESLYLVSLQLAQERFAYTTKFSTGNNGSALDLSNIRNNGQTVERLNLPTGIQVDRMLATGGDLLARFANNILLTFDGPNGFAADVSSSILIQFIQPLIQRDVQFESLTQAERNLVYAVRDFARFRKQFFVDFASDYYDLIASFRQIEINSQNYFSLVRAFNQAEAEYSAGIVPRVQVDQVEQSLLDGRGDLIGTCNALERDLDSLKLAAGLPTETPINLNLDELNELTRLDQLSVSANSTNRVLRRLTSALEKPDRAELASTAAVLLDRLIDSLELTEQGQQRSTLLASFEIQRGRFLMDYARLNAGRVLQDLQAQLRTESPSEPLIFQRSTAYSKALLALADRQLQVVRLKQRDDGGIQDEREPVGLDKEAEQKDDSRPQPLPFEDEEEDSDVAPSNDGQSNIGGGDWRGESAKTAKYQKQVDDLKEQVELLDEKLQKLIEEETIEKFPLLIDESNEIRQSLSQLVDELDKEFQIEVSENQDADLTRIKSNVTELIEAAQQQLATSNFGLKAIDIDMDDAMATALVLRFELMNQRGGLADDWRQIKLAADELKSNVTLDVSHEIGTPTTANQPFDFNFDNSVTSVGLSVDYALNRFAQRNSFRAALIGYQQSIRSLKLLEDSIKFSVRDDLRNLSLDREQYLISVASAALAYERVVSTSLEFRLGTGGVTARDFLEAQTAYTDALSSVANRHIEYLVDRAQLFFNLELLMVDENGFWPDIRNEDVQPEPQFTIPSWGTPVFGELPNVRYSSEVKETLRPVDLNATVVEHELPNAGKFER